MLLTGLKPSIIDVSKPYSFIIIRWKMTAIKSLNTKLRTQYVLHVSFDVWLNSVLTPMCRYDLSASKSDMVINMRANQRCKLALEPYLFSHSTHETTESKMSIFETFKIYETTPIFSLPPLVTFSSTVLVRSKLRPDS